MSCPPEWWVAAYVDDGLEAGEKRQLESHLVGCEPCRGRVLTLRAEARVLGALLREESLAGWAGAAVASPARGVAMGLPAAIGVTALAVTVASALLETRLPSGVDWLRPSLLRGANTMIFDTIFLLRDRAPGWLELASALAALAGLAAVFTFLAGALLRRQVGSGGLAALLGAVFALSGAEPAEAALRLEHREHIRIAAGETHEGTLAVSCESLEIEGVVSGDVLAFCERVAIRGEVEGSVFLLGREHELRGRIAGNAVAFGEQVRVEDTVAGTAYLVGERVELGKGGRLARDAFLAGGRIRVDGVVARDLAVGAEALDLTGEVGRDVELWAERAAVREGARIGGDLRAHLPAADQLEVSEGAVVAGATDVSVLEAHRQTIWSRYREGRFYTWLAVAFVAAFGVGLLLQMLAPRLFEARIETGRDFVAALGLGAAFAVVSPIALVLLALTVVGIPLALIGLAAWAIALYLGAILVAALIGRALVGSGGAGLREFGVPLLVGLAVVFLLRNLPFVGGVAGWVIALVGAGLLVGRLHATWQRSRAGAAAGG